MSTTPSLEERVRWMSPLGNLGFDRVLRLLASVVLPALLTTASGCGVGDTGRSSVGDVHAPLYGTFVGRRDLARFPLFAEAGLNAVVLGHTFTSEQIHEPFDQAGLDQVALFFTTARDNRLRLVFKMTPQRGYSVDSPFPGPDDPRRASEIAVILDKVDTLYEIGVRIFMLCFDDISLNAPRSGFMPGEAQAALLRAVDARLQARGENATRLMVTPPYYAGTAESLTADRTPFSPQHPLNAGLPSSRDFLRDYATLPERIEIFSTGPGIFSATFSAAQVASLATLWGHPIDYWSNFPTNDVFPYELVLEPFARLEPAALPRLRAVLLNRAPSFPEASHIGILTFGEFLANPAAYDPRAAYLRATERMGGSAAAALRLLADQFQSHPMNRSAEKGESAELHARLLEYWDEYAECTEGPASTALQELLDRFSQVGHDLDVGLENRELYDELAPHAEKLGAIGAAGLWTIDALRAACDPDVDGARLVGLATEVESRRASLAALSSRVTEDSVAEVIQAIAGDGLALPPTNIVDEFLSQAHDELISAAARADHRSGEPPTQPTIANMAVRTLQPEILGLGGGFVTGPRQCGKTTSSCFHHTDTAARQGRTRFEVLMSGEQVLQGFTNRELRQKLILGL